VAGQHCHAPELLCVIVRDGRGKKILKKAKQLGFTGATLFYGRGSKNYRKRWLRTFDFSEAKKEIALIMAEGETIDEAIGPLTSHFHFERPHHGIAFRMSISGIIGSGQFADITGDKGGLNAMYKAIFVIVDRGNGQEVIDAACEAGQKGGTIIKARGAGVHETQKLFRMEIAPEKEVVLLLAKSERSEGVIASIRERLDIDKPGNGVIFIQEVSEAYGLLGEESEEDAEA